MAGSACRAKRCSAKNSSRSICCGRDTMVARRVSEGRATISLAHASGFQKRHREPLTRMPTADELRSAAAALHRAGDYLGAAERLAQAVALAPKDAGLH